VATHQYDVTIWRGNREVEKVSAHLDVEGDQVVLQVNLRQLLLDAVDRSGWKRTHAHEFKLTARRPGWADDAFPPYVVPREEAR
jgi:hypothetical protein